MNELKQAFKARESEPELKLVDKTLCGYLKAYEISARRYQDPQKLLTDKKSSLTKKIVNDMLELKGLKFQLALTVRFSKDKKETTGTFYSFQQGITNSNGISDSYNQASSHIENGIEKFTNNGSGWVIDRCETLYLNIAKYEPLKGSSYIPLPKELASKKAIINIKNTDNRCLVHAINSALNPATHHSDRLSSYPVPNFKFEGIDFPTPISQIPKVEKQNSIAINVYGYGKNIVPYYISEQSKEFTRINLLLLHDKTENNYHYCWIKNLNRLLANQNKCKNQTHFCDRCLYGFSREDLLIKHKEDCNGINSKAMRIQMPVKGKNHIKFINHHKQMPVPFVIYADFESIVKPHCANAGDNSEIKSVHEACGFGYQLVRYDGVSAKPVIYRGEDAAEKFLKSLKREAYKINEILKNPKPLHMTEQNEKDF